MGKYGREWLREIVNAGWSGEPDEWADECPLFREGDLLKGGPEALYACKRLVDAVAFRDPADVLDLTARTIAERRASPEAAEGITAFLTKQPANWIPRNDGE